jgi:hypothetical protein
MSYVRIRSHWLITLSLCPTDQVHGRPSRRTASLSSRGSVSAPVGQIDGDPHGTVERITRRRNLPRMRQPLANSSCSGTRRGSPILNRPPVRATRGSPGGPGRPRRRSRRCAGRRRQDVRPPPGRPAAQARHLGARRTPVRRAGPARIELSRQPREAPRTAPRRGQERGRNRRPARRRPQRRLQSGPPDPGPAAAVAEQMPPAVGSAPAGEIGADRDHPRAGGDDRAHPLPQRARVRGDGVGDQREPPYPELAGQRRRQLGAQPVPRVVRPAAPIATARTQLDPGLGRQPRAIGTSCSRRCPASMPRGTGAHRLPGGRAEP